MTPSSDSKRLFTPKAKWTRHAHCPSWENYLETYSHSIEHPDRFWADKASRLQWTKPWKQVKQTSFQSPVSIRWFEGGELNVSSNCLDRHLPFFGNRLAIVWEPDNPREPSRMLTYKELHREVCRAANMLKGHGVQRGDRVTLYLPMIVEAAVMMLACTRIGAIHSVIFGGFSAESIVDRINDCESRFVITADEGLRGGRTIPLKRIMDEALERCPQVKKCIVVRRTGGSVSWKAGRDFWYQDEIQRSSTTCAPESMGAEDPLFLLYTSGSTNKPKAILHSTGGYLCYASYTHEMVFDLRPDDVYFCSADLGWITGHSYLLYGPLSNASTIVLFEGVPTYPDPSRFWQIVDKYRVSLFYTAPTAIRSLMREGNSFVKRSSRQSLRILGTVGEPINPEAWLWYYETIGDGRCPVVDTWWQTETGGILISPLPAATPLKPGSATLPLFGIKPELRDEKGNSIEGPGEGSLCIADSWPGQMRGIYNDPSRFESTYFSAFPGSYFTGDGCRRDDDGYYWITGRIDDVLNIAGHRLGTAEIESALVSHEKVAEAAVVGVPHSIKGQSIYAFVTLKASHPYPAAGDLKLQKNLIQWVRKEIGPIATPEFIHWAPALPKTRSGKIMRRILRKIAEGSVDNLGDISTLADPSVIESLVKTRA